MIWKVIIFELTLLFVSTILIRLTIFDPMKNFIKTIETTSDHCEQSPPN